MKNFEVILTKNKSNKNWFKLDLNYIFDKKLESIKTKSKYYWYELENV